MFKAGWRSDDAIQPSESFRSIANPWFQINSAEYRKAKLCCITMARLSHFGLQNCSSRFEHYSLKHFTGLLALLFIFSPPLISSQDRPYVVFLFLNPQAHSFIRFFYWIHPNIGHEVSRQEPFPSPLWLWVRIALKGLCLVRYALCHHACIRLILGSWAEESVGTQGPGQTSTAARATMCYLLLLRNPGICANLKCPSRRLHSHSTRV